MPHLDIGVTLNVPGRRPVGTHVSIVLMPWKLVCWRARVVLTLLCLGGVLDLYRMFW